MVGDTLGRLPRGRSSGNGMRDRAARLRQRGCFRRLPPDRRWDELEEMCRGDGTATLVQEVNAMIDRDIFEELFVLEMANNHWGSLERGLKIVNTFAQVVRFNNVRAAIKLQFRDVDSFIHKDFVHRTDIRYIKKTLDTRMPKDDFAALVKAIRKASCIPMATPFDETSVDLCCELGIPILKIASSDLNDWLLIEKIAKTKKPVIVSTGGSSLKDLDDLVTFFHNRNIPLAINHCVSLYPIEDRELELNQIDFLRARYPSHTIGFSTHEYHDWSISMLIAYAKGARTFERHIDIEADGVPVSPYCSLPRPGRHLVQGVSQGQGDVRRAGHAEAHAAAEGDRSIWIRWCAACTPSAICRRATS